MDFNDKRSSRTYHPKSIAIIGFIYADVATFSVDTFFNK
jgi:hypothetical protein